MLMPPIPMLQVLSKRREHKIGLLVGLPSKNIFFGDIDVKIGVITKPDCVRYETTASLKQWTDVLSGEKYRVAYTHFVVKNNPDPSVDQMTARLQETQFFEESEPWATLLAAYKSKFGTLQLQDALSVKLIAEIKKWSVVFWLYQVLS